jgi:hypothetical protein
MALADDILDRAYQALGIQGLTPRAKYLQINAINTELDRIHAANPINGTTTGTINERLVQLALEGYSPDSWYHLKLKNYDWLGDFGVNAYPLSVVVSVKSFKAKERLLVSGTGTLYAPTIGWGRFDSPAEFGYKRLEKYLFRGFLAIYMPQQTILRLTNRARQVHNYYGRPFIRPITDFGTDLESALINQAQIGGSDLVDTADF